MVEVNGLYKRLEKLVASKIGRDNPNRDRLLLYFRLYNHLINALSFLNPVYSRKSFYFLKIVVSITASERPKGEEHYIAYIHKIVRDIISNEARIKTLLSNKSSTDPLNSATRLIMAQNICMMRILKLSRVV